MMNSAVDILLSMSKEELQTIVEPTKCPYPIENDDGTAKMCVANGHCGCDEQYRLNRS